MQRLPTPRELRELLLKAMQAATEYARLNPRVDNVDKILRRIRGDLAFITRCIEYEEAGMAAVAAAAGGEASASTSDGKVGLDGEGSEATLVQQPQPLQQQQSQQGPRRAPALDTPRIQGIVNNLRGFQGELQAAYHAPGVIGLLKRFYLAPSPQGYGLEPDGPAAGPSAEADASGAGDVAAARISGSGLEVAEVFEPGRPKGKDKQQAQKGQQSGEDEAGRANGAEAPDCASVEVDVVAQEGSCWIEVKSHEEFGLDSVHWTGTANVKGLRRQALDLLAFSRAACNQRRWRAPLVVVFFPSRGGGPSLSGAMPPPCPAAKHAADAAGPSNHSSSTADLAVDGGTILPPELPPGPVGVGADVVSALTELGVHVAVGAEALARLPPPPPVPSTTNLDVTTMCALVSEACHAALDDPALEAWSRSNVHWRACWQAEQSQGRVLDAIGPWVAEDHLLMASCEALAQFEVLLGQFGGPRERARWARLKSRLDVCGAAADASPDPGEQLQPRPTSGASADVAGQRAPAGGPSVCVAGAPLVAPSAMTARVAELQKVTSLQRSVFGLGDARRALTLTANGNAMRSAERQGVHLEAVIHRAAWLTGM